MERLTEHAARTMHMWVACGRLVADVQSVMVMRLLGLGGAWRVDPAETRVMVEEKLPAFTEAMVGGTLHAVAGRRPDEVAWALIEPFSHKARSNRQRLLQQGPRFPRGTRKNPNRSEDNEPDTEAT